MNSIHQEKLSYGRAPLVAASLLAILCLTMLPAGCGKNAGKAGDKNESKEPVKLTVAYLGLTCEAPIFVAYEKGFYKEEGLDVKLVKTDWDGLREGLGQGTFDANHTLLMYLLKPIEQGMDVKITGGIHTGCLRVQISAKSDIKTVKDLKGKKIGVPTHIGSPPFMFASRVLAANNINSDPVNGDVKWKPYPPDVLGKAVDEGLVDAVATSDPIGTILVGKGLVKTIADQAVDEPYADEYCCVAVVSGKLFKRDPAAAAKVTRALFKGAKWVSENPAAAATACVENKYIAASVEINTQALSKLKYLPGVTKCKESLQQAAKEMKLAGLLQPTTDSDALDRSAWQDLDGVSDEWVKSMKVEQVTHGGRLQLLNAPAFAALFEGPTGTGSCKCCCRCCIE